MPKTNDATGATYAGHEGIVESATGRLDQLDPSRNLDGSQVDGYESDEGGPSSPGNSSPTTGAKRAKNSGAK